MARTDLVSNISVKANKEYFVKVKHHFGEGNYLFRCKNYPKSKVVWPVPASKRVTQLYGNNGHEGMDIGGSTIGKPGDKIVAIMDGTVCRSEWSSSYGWVVYITSNDTFNGKYVKSIYGHMHKRPVVEKGQQVSAGDKVGIMGNTGDSNGIHLHIFTGTFDNKDLTMNKGTWIDPMTYLKDAYEND